MYVIRNAFGMSRVFYDLETALEVYEEECNFCEFCGLYDFNTGATIAESF